MTLYALTHLFCVSEYFYFRAKILRLDGPTNFRTLTKDKVQINFTWFRRPETVSASTPKTVLFMNVRHLQRRLAIANMGDG